MRPAVRILRQLGVGMAVGLCAVVAPTPAQAQAKVSLVFSSGPTGGSWIPMAGATAEVIRKKFPEIDVQVEPGAALVNMEKIRTGKADLGWSTTNVLYNARAGRGVWAGKATDRPLLVATFYPNVWQLVAPASTGIRSVRDLRGKAVALPARGNASLSDGWEMLLTVNGMRLDDLGPKTFGSIAIGAEAMKNGQAMATGWYTTVPASFVQDLGSALKLRMIPVSDAEFARIREINPAFQRYVVKAGTYREQGIEGDIPTFQAPTILIASSTVPADVVYKIARAVVESRADFVNITRAMAGIAPRDMAESYGMPYHPGAMRYYREIGLLK
jgi:TRAP transporter TAXI family solute receptor